MPGSGVLQDVYPWRCVVCLQSVTARDQFLPLFALFKLISSCFVSQTCCANLLWCCRFACFWHHSYCAALPQQSADSRCSCHPSLSYCLCSGKHAKQRLMRHQQCFSCASSSPFGVMATAMCKLQTQLSGLQCTMQFSWAHML